MPYGYQDWQRTQFVGGYSILDVNQAIQNPTTFGTYNVQDVAHILCVMDSLASPINYQVAFSWFEDPFGTAPLGTNEYIVGQGTRLQTFVPVQGPFVQIKITPDVFLNATPIRLNFFGQMNTAGAYRVRQRTGVLTNVTAVLGIGGVRNQLMNYGYDGRVVISAFTSGGNPAALIINYVDFFLGPVTEWCRFAIPGTTAPLVGNISLPASPVTIQIINGGVAQTVTVNVTPYGD